MRTHRAALCIACFAAAPAAADTVDVRFTGTGAGQNIQVALNGNPLGVFAGQLEHHLSNGTGDAADLNGDLTTFCTDLFEYVTHSDKQYDLVDLADTPAPPMGADKADAIADLYGYTGLNILSGSTGSSLAAAFQIAVWEVVHDFDSAEGASSLDVEDGSFQASAWGGGSLSGSVQAHLSNLFGAIGANAGGGSGLRLYGLKHDGAQDQVAATSIPLPAPAMLAAAGLAGVGLTRRRFRG